MAGRLSCVKAYRSPPLGSSLTLGNKHAREQAFSLPLDGVIFGVPRGEKKVRRVSPLLPRLGLVPPSMPATSVTVGMAKFEDLVAIGLHQLISEDPNLELSPPTCLWRS